MSAVLVSPERVLITAQTSRDLREFVEAKRRKKEPLVLKARGAAAARYIPSGLRGFANFRAALRGVGDWGPASERIDALEDALRKRHGVGLPLPRKVIQNEDRSITLFWQDCVARCFVDGFISTIGGTAGIPSKQITNQLLDLLAFQVRIQSSA